MIGPSRARMLPLSNARWMHSMDRPLERARMVPDATVRITVIHDRPLASADGPLRRPTIWPLRASAPRERGWSRTLLRRRIVLLIGPSRAWMVPDRTARPREHGCSRLVYRPIGVGIARYPVAGVRSTGYGQVRE